MNATLVRFIASACFGLVVTLEYQPLHAATMSDDFEEDRNYLAAGFDFTADGVIWDALLAPSGVGSSGWDNGNTFIANTTDRQGLLSFAGTGGGFNQAQSDGTFLYIDGVAENFVAEVDVISGPYFANNELGLMARVPNATTVGAADADERNAIIAVENNTQARIQAWREGVVEMRNILNGSRVDLTVVAPTVYDPPENDGDVAQTVRLRLTRSGIDLKTEFSIDGGLTFLSPEGPDPNDPDTVILKDTFSNRAYAGPLQVGIFHAGYNANSLNFARFDNFKLTIVPEPGTLVMCLAALTVCGTIARHRGAKCRV